MNKGRTARGIALILSAWCGAGLACCAQSRGAGHFTEKYVIEQTREDAPEIEAYVTGNQASAETAYSGEVYGKDLEEQLSFVQKSVQIFQESGEGIRYVILLDNSLSVDQSQFAVAVRELVSLRKGMGNQDVMELYTVGSSHSKGQKQEIVNSRGRKNRSRDIKAIRGIRRNKSQTVLYRSLTKLLASMDNTGERTVVLLLTDGEDDSQGKDNRTYQVNSQVKKTKVPVYGILLKNIGKHPNRKKIANTRRYILEAGRGYYEDCQTTGDTAKTVSKGFGKIKKILQQETYAVTLTQEQGRDVVTKTGSLRLTCDGETLELSKGAFAYQNNTSPDTTGPKVTGHEKLDESSIRLTIEDDSTSLLRGADQPDSYLVRRKQGGKNQELWEVAKVTAGEDGTTFDLTFQDKLYTGDYEITFQNITDTSNAQNFMEETTYTFSFEGGKNPMLERAKSLLKSYWWILVIVILLVLGLIIIVLVRRRNVQVQIDPQSIDGMDSKLIRLTITDAYGNVGDVEIQVEGSYFVGRSQINNLYFEDEHLSKQHFVLEVTKMGCYIEDLQTKNSTFVNSVKISGRRKLSEGDVIVAGKETFVFHVIHQEKEV